MKTSKWSVFIVYPQQMLRFSKFKPNAAGRASLVRDFIKSANRIRNILELGATLWGQILATICELNMSYDCGSRSASLQAVLLNESLFVKLGSLTTCKLQASLTTCESQAFLTSFSLSAFSSQSTWQSHLWMFEVRIRILIYSVYRFIDLPKDASVRTAHYCNY